MAGRPWYNQNWLTHVIQYWLYDRISPDAVIYANWIVGIALFSLVSMAAYWRSGALCGSILAAAITAFGCRYFLTPRAATVGFFCAALLWALICALEHHDKRRRLWPIICTLPLLLFWGNTHGSFVFGYSVIGLYLLHWIAMKLLRRSTRIEPFQVVLLGVFVILALILTIIIGPFGINNFTHGEKVAASPIWRDVAEWQPPYVAGKIFPFVTRFWLILSGVAACFLICVAVHLVRRDITPNSVSRGRSIQISVFDIAVVVISLLMTLWARRFAPLFFIFAPTFVLLLMLKTATRFQDSRVRVIRYCLSSAAGLAGIALGTDTVLGTWDALVTEYKSSPHLGLLERATLYDIVPHESFVFINKNGLELRLLTEWPLAGAVMLHAPGAKVFIDGRAQQVYDESHYREYKALFMTPDAPPAYVAHVLDASQTDSVLLRNWEHGANLRKILEQSKNWAPVLATPDYRLYLRRGGAALERLGKLIQCNEDWWPSAAARDVGSGFVWTSLREPDPNQAVTAWKTALSRQLGAGGIIMRPLAEAFIEARRTREGEQFLEAYRRRIEQAAELDQTTRQQLTQAVTAALAKLRNSE